MIYTIEKIVQRLRPLQSIVRFDDTIEHILTDSRSLSHTKHTLFFALLGESGDGHLYIEQLYHHGVRNFVIINHIEELAEKCPEANFIAVSDTLRALQRLAIEWRNAFQIPVVGITGSNGKTVVKEFLYQLLCDSYNIVRSPKSYNSQLGVPLSVLQMRESHTLALFEAGISKPGEMERLFPIIHPTIGIFTNIGSAHQENFNTLAQKIDEKLQLFADCERIIYNMDDKDITDGLRRAGLLGQSRGWSVENKEATLFVKKIETKEKVTEITIAPLGTDLVIQIPFVDQASVDDVLHCIVAMMVLKPNFVEHPEIFLRLEPVEMRLEVKKGNNNNIIINDVCSNDINSLAIALDFQQRRAKEMGLKRVVVLSEIQQSGLSARQLYHNVADMMQPLAIDHLFVVGKEMTRLQDYLPDHKISYFAHTDDLLAHAALEDLSDSCILVKGARSFQFERIIDRLSYKVHQTTLQVNLEAIVQNLNYYRSLLPKGTQCIGMVKANGYGVGSYEVAQSLDEAHIDALAVAVADEGKELRKAGILSPILVMNPEESAFDTLINYTLEPVIFSRTLLERLCAKISKQGFSRIAIHLEIDTGMHRLGFSPEELIELVDFFKGNNLVYVKSLFTHLAAADDPEQDAFTLRQIECFTEANQRFAELMGYTPLRHILNTAGTERFPEQAADMVRLGIGLYGISSSGDTHLAPALRLRTTLLQKKNILPGDTIGYGRKGLLPEGGTIGIIPIGYADGYDRRFSQGRGWVSLRGKRCPIIGNICMDTCMIDLTHCPEAEEGDEVILFGDALTDIGELARSIDTISYELIADLSPRIQRVYFRA
ncbi:bifunctional UDP-N-acetylmuramoyl-tripeptide:D-alanyl-D-alanine ligase/alanine racemase [Porphyromonas circumdentaria]|uniref:bifunctional UDP-N-acetylmuramoyl-tripeptide:D-alanyl-D-alanine ligase/alanine racemase n=1 Tax=Porphyromonas circumdentaria TaxID=29524 RepID=UPI0026DC6D25|nr:bifunctional UDP-N-acetylmuramoyl-tripeptide:D-alanyl-D-alanine ligase/alanine racemase [Porphyromonas circumdentaria]MDO4722119.1 bifunctional UDP-N-acetylmuramoyl-tripeptide:D-alanyl-D-alanine ligase/alanine racemase [Porphyromonas circumdentaria]